MKKDDQSLGILQAKLAKATQHLANAESALDQARNKADRAREVFMSARKELTDNFIAVKNAHNL